MRRALDLIPLTVGCLTMSEGYFLDGSTDTVTVPVTSFLLVHPGGLAVFDTGLGPRFCRPDGAPLIGGADLEESTRIDARIRSAGYDPDDVETIINSHLHADHAGGNAWLPHAEVVVQRTEWDHAVSTDEPAYERSEFMTGQQMRLISGELDVFGDGRAMIVPTPGHTPGHQSLRVITEGGPAVLAGDACNLRRALDDMWLPPKAHDLDAYRSSLEWFAQRRTAGDQVFFSHDANFWRSVRTGEPWAERIP
jgi:glyoxylase-like metal-dependent hydrolase (beta-lactamase superfamily II)